VSWAENRRWRRMFDGVGPIPPDDENEPDPDEITDWTENRSPTMGMQNYDDVAERYTPEQMAEAVANLDAELTKTKAELATARAQQAAPDLSPQEAAAQIEAIPRLIRDEGGHWIDNPERLIKVREIAARAGVGWTDRHGRPL
jgi:hypothetical protein